MMKKKVDIVVPCYNEEQCIQLFYKKMDEVFEKIEGYNYSILFVDDGSKDLTLKVIKELAQNVSDGKIRYISFSRNFGKESAMVAGLEHCDGDLIAVMDADLQHPPELLLEMIEAVEIEGYDCCAARRADRNGETIVRSFFSRQFYRIMNKLTVIDLVQGSTDFRLMKREVAEAVVRLRENERFTKGIYAWVGFKTKWIPYENVERIAGKSKWSFKNLFNYAGNGIIAFATTPLRGIIYLGIIITIISVLYAIQIIWGAIVCGGERTGFATIIVLMLFLGGVILITLGMIGEYVARIYMEVKNRPLYITRETNIHSRKEKKDE